jgi:hypothetical protein
VDELAGQHPRPGGRGLRPHANPDVETGWGYGHIYDISDKANPVELATLKLPSTHQFPPPGPGDFTIHDPKITGKRLYTSWYTEGVAVWNIANPSSPQIIGQFIPPENAEDPLGLFYPGEAFVEIWGRHRLRLRRRFRHEHRPLGVPRALISAQDHVFDARAGSQNPALALAARRESNL